MSLRAMLQPIIWWTQHPWIVWWIIPIVMFLMVSFVFLSPKTAVALGWLPWVLAFVWYASFIQGIRGTWRRNRVKAALIVGAVLLPLLVAWLRTTEKPEHVIYSYLIFLVYFILVVSGPIVTEYVVRAVQRRRGHPIT